jgi:hypothetical protein
VSHRIIPHFVHHFVDQFARRNSTGDKAADGFTEGAANRTARELSARAAYTLPEVMMAVVVVGTMTVSLYAGFCSGFAILRQAREDLRATQILTEKVEAIRLLRWSDLTARCPIQFSEPYDPAGDGTGVIYAGTITTNTPPDVPATTTYLPNLVQVRVSLYWTNGTGASAIVRSREVSTLVARYGLQNYAWGAAAK